MAVILVHPCVTLDTEEALSFVTAWRAETAKHLPLAYVESAHGARAQGVGAGDQVVFINAPENTLAPQLLAFLDRAAAAGAVLHPIALDVAQRVPPGGASAAQSYDVTEELRRRSLGREQLSTVAVAHARIVVARSQPTLSKERIRLFLSHRRLDGENVTARIWSELKVRGEVRGVFRDLADVRVGTDAQNVIMANLALSDTVVFLDTPRSGESEWIALELKAALAKNLPIVWVRIGSPDGRAPLAVRPGDKPHLDLPYLDPAADAIDPLLADQILDAAFVVSREAANRIFESVDRLERLQRTGRIETDVLDSAHMLYEVRLPRTSGRYPQRPLRQLVQFFGRWPSDEDTAIFARCASAAGFDHHPRHGAPYDAAVLAAPIPNQPDPPAASQGGSVTCYVDAADAYVQSLEDTYQPHARPRTGWAIILSGAFPADVDPVYEQETKSALHAFAYAIFNRGGSVIFGGHPTFQPMILQMARDTVPDQRAERTQLYVSGYFVTPAAAAEMRADASTHLIPAEGDDRDRSLTAMRRAMISNARACALVAIGGRGPSPGRSPGVDEEVALAQERRLPVFLVAGVGGRTAGIAAGHRAGGWGESLNGLSAAENEELFLSREYGTLAELVLSRLGL